MKRTLVLLLCLLWVSPAAAQRPMQVDDLFRFKRVADPQISPDGKTIVYAVTSVDLQGNRTSTNLWLVSTLPGDGPSGKPRQLTTTNKSDRHPRWSPDGKQILFESSRSGETQLWVIDVGGGEARQLTHLSTGASNGIWSRDGKAIAFVSAVWPEYSDKPFKESDALNRKRMEEAANNPVKAKVFTRLFYRHWDEYVEDKRQHLFVMPFANGQAGEPRDVTPGDRDAYPTSATFAVGDDFTFSPDSKYLVFTAVPERDEAWSTNYDVCRVPVTGGKVETLTKDNPAADGGPRFSPDGKWLAYRAQKRAGFEADRWELMITDAEFKTQPRSVTAAFDSWVEEFVWASNSATIYFVAEEKGTVPIWQVNIYSGQVTKVREGPSFSSLSAAKHGDHDRLVFLWTALHSPAEVFATTMPLPPIQKRGPSPAYSRSQANKELLAELHMMRPDNVTVPGAGGTPMQMWILKPPGFDATKKWPVAYLVHGGPQGAWTDGWSYRWNPQVWAAQGYVVALPNPRGSTGFGQKYVEEISGDWGGKCYEDLMLGVDWLEKQPWVDKDRIASAGGSFGGYMMNWFAVNTGRFKCLITHCSVWNFESMYATTDELWFDEWEHGGPPWGKGRHSYEKHSPHRFAANLVKFKTPMLVIHNDLDFRCPIGQGHELFTTLQRLGVPSRMINFPDEGHWVLRPRNSEYWHREVFAWLTKYAPPGGR
jgi:dipeptidyl aminopeptidase/acylaminoacyl peptidase